MKILWDLQYGVEDKKAGAQEGLNELRPASLLIGARRRRGLS